MRALDRLVVRQFIDHALAMGRGSFLRGRMRFTGDPDRASSPCPVRRRLGTASRDDMLSCPAAGWGIVLAGTVILEMCQPDRPGRTVFLLREGDIWSVPRTLGGIMRCPPRTGADLMCCAAGGRATAGGLADIFTDTDDANCVSDVFCRRQNESSWVEVGWGRYRVVEGSGFTDPDAFSAILVEIDPGCRTDLHWHLNADAWQVVLAGDGVLTQLARSGSLEDRVLSVGTFSHVPRGEGHFIVNRSQGALRLLKLFASDHYHDLTLPQWLATSSPDEVAAHLHLPSDFVTSFSWH